MTTPRKPRKKAMPKLTPQEREYQRALAAALRGNVTASQLTVDELLQNIWLDTLQTPLPGDTPLDWGSRLLHYGNAKAALKSGNIDILCYSFLRIGNLDSRFPAEHLQELLEGHRKRTLPFVKKRFAFAVLKDYVQDSARQIWANDKEHEQRIGSVALSILKDVPVQLDRKFPEGNELGDLLKKHFPAQLDEIRMTGNKELDDERDKELKKRTGQIKKWLKEEGIAPKYAQKRGPNTKG